MIDFRHEIVVADFGSEAQLLVPAVMPVAAMLPLFLLVFELAKVHDPADGRLFLRRHLHQIKTR